MTDAMAWLGMGWLDVVMVHRIPHHMREAMTSAPVPLALMFAAAVWMGIAQAQTIYGNIVPLGAAIKLGDPGQCSNLKGKEWPARWILQCDNMFMNGRQTCVPAPTCFSSPPSPPSPPNTAGDAG